MVDFYKSLLKSRVLALMHGSKQLQYSASVVRTSGNISMCILIRILKLQLLKGIDLLWKSSAVYMYINQNILDIHISHIQQFFPEKKQRFEPKSLQFSCLYTGSVYIFVCKIFYFFWNILFIFHTDDVSLPSSWLRFRLVEAIFPHSLTNQKHYTDLGRLVMHHQNRISALASHTSFHRESSDDVAKCWLFSQDNSKAIPGISLVYKFIQVFFIWKLLSPNFKTETNSRFFFRDWS